MKDSKNIVIGLLCTVLCIMAVAYAAFSTSLEISGTATVASNWNVAVTNVACTPVTATVDGKPGKTVEAPSVTGLQTATVIVGVDFNQPGDNVTCVVTVTNGGNLDAKLVSITPNPNPVVNTTYTSGAAKISDFIHFTLGNETNDTAKLNAVLKAGNTHTYTIYAEYKDVVVDGTSVDLPTGVDSREVSVTFNYQQNLTAATQE